MLCSAIDRNEESVNESNKMSIVVHVRMAWGEIMELEIGINRRNRSKGEDR